MCLLRVKIFIQKCRLAYKTSSVIHVCWKLENCVIGRNRQKWLSHLPCVFHRLKPEF